MSCGLDIAAPQREIGVWDCGRPGPTLLVIAGIHGNEPAGVHAVRNVLGRMQELALPIVGRIVALAGNLQALASRQRFIDRDLNRGWNQAAIAKLRAPLDGEPAGGPKVEDVQQLELLSRFEHVIATASGPVVVADLHTSSAAGPPFLCLADTIDNRRVGLATGVPIILGVEETIDGASLEWFADRGIIGLAVEGGQHDEPTTIANHEAVLWRILDYLRMLPAAVRGSPAIDLAACASQLAKAVGSAPPIVEIVHRRTIAPQDGFVMEPGFVNFQPAAKGELLARDRAGEIRAPRAALVMLPLYQKLGDDGFFLARRVRPFWLHLASCLRALRLDRLVVLMPGVRRDRDHCNRILVDPGVARWFVTEVFHLLGDRKRRQHGVELAFTRRTSAVENRRLGR